MRVNFKKNATPQFRVLSEDQIEEILSAAYEILERVGVKVHTKQAVDLLCDVGARSQDGVHVKVPSFMIKRALNTVPERIVLTGRDGSRDLVLEKDHIYFGTGSDCPSFVDPETGERRATVSADVVNAARVADALDHIDFFMSLGLISDVPRPTYDRHQFLSMVSGTKKPLVITAIDAHGLADQYEMASIIVGGRDKFCMNPLFAVYTEPSSPFIHTENALDKLIMAANHGIPVIYTPGLSAGATAPVTLAGALAEGIADTFVGLVISQLIQPGAPFIMGGVFTVLDMRTMIFSYGAPELLLMGAALTDISKFLGIPMFSTAGCSDSKVLDQQAALEAGMSILMAAQTGASLIHDVGYLEYGLLGSLDMLVLSNEAISMAKRLMGGIPVTTESLAVDVMTRVGPGGHFLVEDHTLKHFKQTLWNPELLDRTTYEMWEKNGRQTMGDRVREKVRRILDTHPTSEIDEKTMNEMKLILAYADKKQGT